MNGAVRTNSTFRTGNGNSIDDGLANNDVAQALVSSNQPIRAPIALEGVSLGGIFRNAPSW